MVNDPWRKAIAYEVCFWILNKHSLQFNPEESSLYTDIAKFFFWNRVHLLLFKTGHLQL